MSASRFCDKRAILYQAIGERLAKLRQLRGIPIADVMQATGITRGTLQKVEEGVTCPMHTVAVLADYYGVSIADIVPSLREVAA
jgi:transcriptional regulator with XRE-family HTH domain